MRALRYTPTKRRATQGERVVWRRPRPRRFRRGGRNDDYTLLGRLHSTRQAATDTRHTRERRPLHNRHSRAGGNPAARSGIRPINSVSPPRRRRAWRSSVAGMGAIQLDLPPRRFRRGGRNDDYSTRQATLCSAGGHRRPSYPRKETFAQPSFPRRRVSSDPKRHSSHQQRLAASTSARVAVICRRHGRHSARPSTP